MSPGKAPEDSKVVRATFDKLLRLWSSSQFCLEKPTFLLIIFGVLNWKFVTIIGSPWVLPNPQSCSKVVGRVGNKAEESQRIREEGTSQK